MSRPPLPTPLAHRFNHPRTSSRRRPPNPSHLGRPETPPPPPPPPPPPRPPSPLPTLTTALTRYRAQTTADKYSRIPGQFDITNPVHVNIRRKRSIEGALFDKDKSKQWNVESPSPSHTTTTTTAGVSTGGGGGGGTPAIPSSRNLAPPPSRSSFYNLTAINTSASNLPDITLTPPTPETQERRSTPPGSMGLKRTTSYQSNLSSVGSIPEEEEEEEDSTSTSTAMTCSQSSLGQPKNVSSYRGVQTSSTPPINIAAPAPATAATTAQYNKRSSMGYKPTRNKGKYPSKMVVQAWHDRISGRQSFTTTPTPNTTTATTPTTASTASTTPTTTPTDTTNPTNPTTTPTTTPGRFTLSDDDDDDEEKEEDEEDEEFGDTGISKEHSGVEYISTAEKLRQFLKRFIDNRSRVNTVISTFWREDERKEEEEEEEEEQAEEEEGEEEKVVVEEVEEGVKKGGVDTLGYRIFEIDPLMEKTFEKAEVPLLFLPSASASDGDNSGDGNSGDGKDGIGRKTGYILRHDSGGCLIGLTRYGWYRVPFRRQSRKWVFGGARKGVEYLGLDEEVVEGRIRWLGEFWEYDIQKKEEELEEVVEWEKRREGEEVRRAERSERLMEALKRRGAEF
ncbi:hypothetical protein AA313_de0206141 [Arthrobotrys entomopaga]|nr:hypothetical protein AA313_de0206141 [Arthrobotrys entomopaga]